MIGYMLLTIILIPIIGSFFIPLLNKVGIKPAATSMLLVSLVFLNAVFLMVCALHGQPLSWQLVMPFGFGPHFNLDLLAAFMAVCASFLSLVIVFYSLGYIEKGGYQVEYYTVVTLFLGSMMGLVFTVNMIWMFVFWEMTAICSWQLVGYFRKDTDKKKAVKTFLITVFGALFLLMGVIALHFSNQTVDLTLLKGAQVPMVVCILLVVGMFSKSAILPFSTWLPDAGVAPSPVTALLHAAVLVKIGVYAFARVFYTINLDPSLAYAIMIVAGISTIIAGGAAIMETNIKRIIAYSTISQLGFIFLALATRSAAGLIAGMLFIMLHGIAKGGLFLSAGIIEHRTHTKDITKMGGLFKVMPVTAVSFAICALSVMGIPPLGGFFSKFMVMQSAVSANAVLPATLFFIAACFTAAYLLRAFHIIFVNKPAQPWDEHEEGTKETLISVAFLAALTIIMTIFISLPISYLVKTAAQMGVL
ncbi:NADH:ubiquinone oxidoreductase subunit 5 (subunit L)/multisubunit Na+/H+ antiporter MnhA subunit [Elusimicrobium posterum]|uniref:NADH-quinone oxidoreductase subunit 5 family protein n=1 Tax=Elusimicrobium posterum TaxID=3116653 RepID=UPI003C730EDC